MIWLLLLVALLAFTAGWVGCACFAVVTSEERRG